MRRAAVDALQAEGQQAEADDGVLLGIQAGGFHVQGQQWHLLQRGVGGHAAGLVEGLQAWVTGAGGEIAKACGPVQRCGGRAHRFLLDCAG